MSLHKSFLINRVVISLKGFYGEFVHKLHKKLNMSLGIILISVED